MWPSIGGRIKRCTIRTVPCLQFTQNQNAVELHVWWRHDLDMSNEGGGGNLRSKGQDLMERKCKNSLSL